MGGEESGGRTTTRHTGRKEEGSGRRRAVASIDKSRQRVFDLEVFISQLLLRREAFPEAAKRGGADADAAARAEGGDEAGAGRRCSGQSGESGDRGRPNAGIDAGGNCAGAPCRSALATDYHCVTAGLMDGGRRVRVLGSSFWIKIVHVLFLQHGGGAVANSRESDTNTFVAARASTPFSFVFVRKLTNDVEKNVAELQLVPPYLDVAIPANKRRRSVVQEWISGVKVDLH